MRPGGERWVDPKTGVAGRATIATTKKSGERTKVQLAAFRGQVACCCCNALILTTPPFEKRRGLNFLIPLIIHIIATVENNRRETPVLYQAPRLREP